MKYLLILALFTTACFSDVPELIETEDGEMTEAAADETDKDVKGVEKEEDAEKQDPKPDEVQTPICTPKASCAEDVCGAIDDGCGGVLECQSCGCVDGVA